MCKNPIEGTNEQPQRLERKIIMKKELIEARSNAFHFILLHYPNFKIVHPYMRRMCITSSMPNNFKTRQAIN